MNSQEKDAFLEQVASTLALWTYLPGATEYQAGVLVRQDGLEVVCWSHKGKLKFGMYTRAEAYRTSEGCGYEAFATVLAHKQEAPSIGMNPARGHGAAAKDIERKLIPACEDLHAKALQTAVNDRAYHANRENMMAMLGMHRDTRCRQKVGGFSVELNAAVSTVDMKIESLTTAQALAVKELLTTLV